MCTNLAIERGPHIVELFHEDGLKYVSLKPTVSTDVSWFSFLQCGDQPDQRKIMQFFI